MIKLPDQKPFGGDWVLIRDAVNSLVDEIESLKKIINAYEPSDPVLKSKADEKNKEIKKKGRPYKK